MIILALAINLRFILVFLTIFKLIYDSLAGDTIEPHPWLRLSETNYIRQEGHNSNTRVLAESGELPACRTDDFKYGQWINGSSNCGLQDVYVALKSGDLRLGFVSKHFYKVSPDDTYKPPFPWASLCWKPKSCKPQPFSPEEFCKKVHNKTLLFVGDSLLYSTYLALYFQLGTLRGQRAMGMRRTGMGSVIVDENIPEALICNGNAKVHFIRNDHLTVNNEGGTLIEDYGFVLPQFYSNNEWKSALPKVDYLIFNKGHHATLRENITLATYRLGNQRTIEYLKQYKESSIRDGTRSDPSKRLQIFFVTTSIGHPFCSKFSKPRTDIAVDNDEVIAKLEADYASNMPEDLLEERFGWHRFFKRDREMIAELKSSLGDWVNVIDVNPMTMLRPDGHRFYENHEFSLFIDRLKAANTTESLVGDCLHYYLPSVIDNWVYVLFNAMT